MKLKSHRWWDHSTRDFAALDMENIVAVLPVGAVEQHGPHLPVKVDAADQRGDHRGCPAANAGRSAGFSLADDARWQSPTSILPSGHADAIAPDPSQLVARYLRKRRRTGSAKKIIVFNSHGGQPQVIDILCREMRVKHGVLAVNAMWARMTNLGDLYDAAERRHGIHAGEVETSVMMHIDGRLRRYGRTPRRLRAAVGEP